MSTPAVSYPDGRPDAARPGPPAGHVSLAEKIVAAKSAAGNRGFAVTFTGPAAEAHCRGCVDGYHGRPNAAATYATLTEQESYDYGWHSYRREPRDKHGLRYEEPLF